MRDWDFLTAGDPSAVEAVFSRFLDRRNPEFSDLIRRQGWLAARLDPLAHVASTRNPTPAPLVFDDPDLRRLAEIYCGSIGWEFGHIQDMERFDWLAANAEADRRPTAEDRKRALCLIVKAEVFENALAKRLPTVKTFGLSGCEGFLVAVDEVIRASGAESVCVGGMHRGRLTQLALVFDKPLDRLIAECRDVPDVPEEFGISSDVPYHLGWEGVRADGVAAWVAPHPSHLSLSASVASGLVRGRGDHSLPLMLHTDAAFAGQGVNAELLQLSGLPPYDIGGSVHIILNNQIGFTTRTQSARTARSCADFAKIIEAPILHVNGNDVDAVQVAAMAAARYRGRFGADVVLDIIGFRRPGHNEVEDPRVTQPELYRSIDEMPQLSRLYCLQTGAKLPDPTGFRRRLDAAFKAQDVKPLTSAHRPAGLSGDVEACMCVPVETGIDAGRLRQIGRNLVALPAEFRPHKKVEQFLTRRRDAFETGSGIDWAGAEALAFASLAGDGHGIRFSGQDSVRGAFSQRHFLVHDQVTGRQHSIFSTNFEECGETVELFDTPLIENAVLGFEYGHSIATPAGLTVWEAQFGDFLNVCQAMFDQYIAGGEQRWLFSSALVMLLPHGWDGGGPDHSTGHLERVLGRCAQGNLQVVNASTPAQYFHVLRRQLKRDFKKPLIVLAPKSLLRNADCRSDLSDLGPGTGFETLLDDCIDHPGQVKRVLICSGKIFYRLEAERKRLGVERDVALVRLEQIYPFPGTDLGAVLLRYQAAEIAWVQEEPENLGAFLWLDRKLEAAAGRRVGLISRPASASPAVGWRSWHEREESGLLERAFRMSG